MNDPIFTILKDPVTSQYNWEQTFRRWGETGEKSSLDFLRTIRKDGFLLKFRSIEIKCWLPTILNQVVNLNGTTFLKSPLIRCIKDDVSFDIVLAKKSPYTIERIDIDVIEDLGSTTKAQRFLNDLMELSDYIGCPLRISDHAEVGSMVPCTLIALLNNQKAKTHPQESGFNGATIERSTREKIAFWRVQHQDQLIHFVNTKGRVDKTRIVELCAFFKNNLPNDLQKCILKLSLREYIRPPYKIKKYTFHDLCI